MKVNWKILYRSVFALCVLVMTVNTYFLHHASEKIKDQKAQMIIMEEMCRIQVLKEFDKIAWEYSVTSNKQHVTGTKRYYKCDVIKQYIENELK